MKKFLVCLPAVLFILFSVFILSCEVGLGESVDTEAPKISITYPDAKSVIKDRFVLAGECSDDRMVSSVQVTILDSANKPVTGYELKAPVVETGKSSQVWSVEINARKEDGSYPLKDGKYTFRTIATDGAGRKSAPFERDLEIDNTAPVFVINSPGSTETETSYGSVLKVEGSIAEAHSVKSMTLTVYNTDGTEKAKWTEENINIAGGTAVTFAKYYSNTGVTDSLLTRYNEIYDEQAGGFQAFKCSVELTDSACVYQKPDFVPSYNRSSVADQPSSSGGNTTSDVWLYDDIYGTDAKYVLMGTKASEVWGRSFEVSDFMNILNGTVPYDTKNSDGKTVLEVLNTAKTDTSATSLKLKLNKDANPTYTVMGYSFDSTAENDGVLSLSPAAKGGTITFKADAGLDGVLFSPATIKVYMFGPFEKDAVTSKQLSDIYSDPDSYAAGNAAVTTILYDGKNGVKGGNQEIYGPYTGESRSTWTQSLSLPSDSKILKATKCYVIAATGEDKDNVEFISENNRYNGFEAQATGVPPSVSITSPGADSISNEPQDILTIKGTIKSDEGTAVNDASYEIYVYDVTDNNAFLGTIKNRDANSDVNGSMEITGTLGVDPEVSFEIDASKGTWYPAEGISQDGTKPASGKVFKYLISVSGVTDITGKDSVTAQVDLLEPTASVEVSTLLSSDDKENCVNGEITVKTSLSDNDKIAQSWIEITGALLSEPVKIDDRSSGVTNYSFQFDTTTINDGDYNVTVYAKDNAGNIGSSSQEICIDQSTDLPVITLSNADEKITEIKDIKVGENLFDQTGNNKLSGAVVDDDGIAEIKIEYKENGSSKAFEKLCTLSAGGKTSYSFSQALETSAGILKEGFYLIKITATDNAKGKTNTTPEFAICISNNAPSITFINPVKNSESYQKEMFTASGTVSGQFNLSDGNTSELILKRGTKAVTVTREGDDYKWNEDITLTDISGNSENTGITTNDRVLYTITYTVTDSFGRETTDYVKFRFDNTPPVVEINDYEQPAYIGLTRTTIYSFGGNVVEENGIKSLEYSINGGVTWTSISAQKSINANIDFKNIDKEEAKVQFKATDEADNVSETTAKSSRTVKIIKNAPEFGASFTLNVTGGTAKQDGNTYYVNNPFTITGTVTSAALKNVMCGSKILTFSQSGDVYSFETTEFNTSGNYTFTAEDMAGQMSSKTVSVVFDSEPPVPEISQVSPRVTGYERTPAEYENGAVNGAITVQGSSTDNDKVSSTVLKVYKAKIEGGKIIPDSDEDAIQSLRYDGTEQTGDAVTAEISKNTANNYKFTIDTTKLGFDDTGIIICIESTDRTGNVEAAEYPVYVCQETDKPVLKFSNGDVTITDESKIKVGTNLFGMGSNTLYINVSDDDGIQSVLLTVDGGTSAEKTESLLTAGKSTTWSTSKDISEYGSGVHSLKFTITDTEGKTVSYPENSSDTIKIAFDDDVPSVSVTKFVNGNNEVTYTEGCFAPADFTLNGTVKDSSGTVKIYYKEGETETEVDSSESCTESQNWTHDISGESSGNDKTRTYIARDKYGRESSVTIKYKVDTEKPVFSTEYISITGEIASGSKTYPLSSYVPADVWFTNASFSIRGTNSGSNKPVIEENGFTIQLKIGDDVISTLQPGANNTFSGTVDVGTTEEDYSKTITLIATDEAGNTSSPLEITVNVDKYVPVVSGKDLYTENPAVNPSVQALADGSFVNKEKLYFKYALSDSVSGVSEIEVYKTAAMKEDEKIGINTITSPSGGDVEGVIEIDISGFDSKEYDFYVKVTDEAGNVISGDLANFTFDKAVPVVSYLSPSAGSAVNKTISLEGTISDLNPPDLNSGWNWGLKVKKPGASSFTEVEGYTFDTSLSTGKFKVSGIDTTKINEGDAEFIVIATDKAGNIISESSGNTLKLNINQDSDRPVISLSTISTGGTTTLSSGTIAGTVSDDDGVDKLEIQVVKKNGSVSASGWAEVTLNGANWSYTYSDGTNKIDGDYKLYFRGLDKTGGVFTSSDTELSDPDAKLSFPKINYNGSGEVSSAVSFCIDTDPPVIGIVQYKVSSDESVWSDWTDLGQNTIFGGVEKRYVQFRLEAHDTVTSQEELSVSVTVSGTGKTFSTKDSTVTLNNSGEQYNNYYYFETSVIDVSGSEIATGSYTLGFDVRDKAEKPSTQSYQIRVDNTAPDSITVRSDITSELTGKISINGLCSDETKGNSGVKELYYVIPKSSIISPENVTGTEFGEKWDSVTLTGIWELEISSENLCVNEDSGITVKDGFKEYETSSNSGVFNLPLWFKIVDNVGNVAFKTDNFIRYNPDADKPRVSITYPVHNVKDSARNFSYVIMGGTVRFTGTATDDEGIEGVYLQFDMDGDGIYENGENVTGCPYDYDSTVVSIPQSGEMGVKANGTQSWNYSLKISGLEGLLYSETNYKTLNIRVVAVDTGEDKQLVGAWAEPVHISVNKDIPAFETVKISQYDTNTPPKVLKTVDYEDDKFISGENWYLIGKISSNAGISLVEVEDSAGTDIGKIQINAPDDITDNNNYILAKTESSGKITELEYKIPVTGEDNWAIKITITDNSEEKKTNYSNYSLNIDNTPPAFYDVRQNSEVSKYGTIKIYSGEYGNGGQVLGDVNKIQNSNGMFTLAGRTTESGSGYENILFYFKRVPENVTAQNPVRVYNPMKAHGSSNKENRTDITVDSATNGKVYVNSDGLPVLYAANVTRNENNEFELTSDLVKGNDDIRKGGLVKIGGIYRKILNVDGTAGTVTFDSECDYTCTEAEFVYAMVIDNSGESLNNDNSIKNDDGDGMVESYSKSGTNYTWDASVDSTHIPDGPIELHIVAFDKAGNSNHGYVKTSVSNNTPRIARVRLATDLNGNSTYEENESQVFAYLDTDSLDWNDATKSKGTEIWNLDGKVNGEIWTIKNNLQIETEFVGGTAPFYYIFTKEDGTGDVKNLSSPKTGTKTGQINQNKEAFVISNSMLDTSDSYEDKTNTYQFSFWDSTEETTPCTDSQWTILNVQLKQDIVDNFAPKVVVKPFYWNSASDNSLYENFLDNGHIELEADLKFDNTPFTYYDGEYDKDPKVSGKIVFRGTAYDDVRLSSLWIKFTDFTFSNYVTEAGYGTDGTSDGYVQAAFYDNANNVWKVPAAKLDDDGWTFEAENEYFDQKGHKVNWTLTIDTSKIAEVAETDVVFAAMAVDHGKLASSEDNSNAVTESGETDTSDKVYNKPKYRVDVVPYITGLDTVLTDLEVLNPSVYGRSALGKYPVYYYRKTTSGGANAEKIILKGFNISGGTVTFSGPATATGTIDESNAISIPEAAKSGEISITVNEVSSLNNKNADVEYNLQPNGQNNNILTDNVELAIWEINSKAAISKTGELSEVVMHVNPANGMLGFAFAHSQDLASYPNGTTSSYQTWMTDWTGVNQIGFIYDQKGNMFGTNGGTDTYTPSKKTGRFGLISSFWGTIATDSGNGDNITGYTGDKRLRLEYLGYWGTNSSYASNVNRFAKGDCSQFATTDNGNYTNLYIIYYDNTLGELKFRAGSYDTVNHPVPNGGCFSKGSVSFGDFADDAYNATCEDRNNYNPTYAHTSIISNVTSGADGNSNAKPGTYYSIAAVKGGASDGSGNVSDVVSVVWYDETNKSLWYSYIENPLDKAGSRNANGAVSTEWATPIALLSGNAGESCAIAADTDGHIHIAAYSRSNAGSLYYIYLDRYNSAFDPSKNLVKVDSYGSTGQYITMEVAKDSNGKNIPYIGYWMNSMSYPKYTYLVDTSSSEEGAGYYPKAGVDDSNLYTGAWESIMLPTSSAVLRDDINIGLYRYLADENGHKKGEIRVIPKREDENAGTVNGIAGGNGTSNPVLAYGIAETGAGYIETAQLK